MSLKPEEHILDLALGVTVGVILTRLLMRDKKELTWHERQEIERKRNQRRYDVP